MVTGNEAFIKMPLSWGTACLCLALTAGVVEMPQIISHRGESLDRPENTMAAFRLAFARGVDGVECDVYATTDGVPVIIHDATTGRTAGAGTNLTVTASSWNDLKDVRVGAFGKWIGTEWEAETLPRFEDYLALLASNETTKCVVELKGNGANGLVNAVVAAVQAQPLATKERVVFIAFDSSLVSAVRAALPDYEAWLLLSGGTYTGADLVSSIQACNATGVDILYSATYAAEDVAAVKAAGHAFAVWTPNSDATAFALAQMGVDAITTDRGGEMKTALAALVAEANSWNEIYDATLPDGAQYLDVGAYVTNGLVAHFDGIRNAGATLPHNSAATTWKNLVSGGPDATFSAAGGGWAPTKNGFTFDGNEYARLASGIVLGPNLTIQLVTDLDLTAQKTGYYPTFFHYADKDFGIYGDNRSGTSTTVAYKSDGYGSSIGGNRPSVTWAGKYVTALLGDGTNKLIAETAVGSKTRATTATLPSARFLWGGSSSDGVRRNIIGTYHAVRLYNRALDDGELAWNRMLDDVRFRGADTNVNVIVDSNVAGLEGTEANGKYLVNGHHAFSASARTAADGNEWEPVGYKLERWNADRLAWDVGEEHAGTTFAYTNCTARPRVRVTWNWRLKNGVKKYDADSYVQAGLVLNFDGLRNAGMDLPHDPAAATWKNLGSGPDATRKVFDAAKRGAWAANGYDFKAGDCFVTDYAVKLARQATVQFAADYDESVQSVKWPSIFGVANIEYDRFGFYTYTPLAGGSSEKRGDHLRFNTSTINNLSFGIQPWRGRFENGIIDFTRSSHSQTAAYNWKYGSYSGDIGTYTYGIGTAWAGDSNRKVRAYTGVIHALRLYDRVLTVTELAYNMAIDNIRFYGTAGRSAETDLVEVRSEVPGIALEDEGGWLVRGTGTKTFTAPAATNVGNCAYTCAGYRLETWNAAKRMWEEPVVMADQCSASVVGTTGQPNRRITWLWTRAAGLRTAADYDVSDYVQQGLVAHYDGIRNRGASSAHAERGMYWRDLSYRAADMIAASNSSYTAWIANGHHFTAPSNSFFRTSEAIDLGWVCSFQCVMDVVASEQTRSGNYWPTYFGAVHDQGMFTVKTGTELAWKLDDFCSDNNSTDYPRAKLQNFEGKYINAIVDGVSANKVYLSQTTERGSGVGNKKKKSFDGQTWTIAGCNSNAPDEIAARTMTGDYHAFRIYNRALTDAELARNRKVDEIRYRGGFTNYVDVVVVNVQPEGASETVQGSVPDGEYELVGGAWTFTAAPIDVGGLNYLPKYTLETRIGGEWVKTASASGESCTVTKGSAPVRLTWQWRRTGVVISIR